MSDLGLAMASLPNSEIGDRAPRLLLSVPTGQYVAWLLANGAFQADPKLGPEPQIGDKVVMWLDQQMKDFTVEEGSDNKWIVRGESSRGGEIGLTRIPGVKLPDDVPEDRGQGKPTREYRGRLSELPGKRNNYSLFYQDQCCSPIVIIGDGAQYLHRQREQLIDQVPRWLDGQSLILMDQDTLQVTNADRMFFHPFMIFSPGVARDNPWLRALKPRLVVVTRWNYFKRMDPTLFAGSPMVILANRRVTDNWNAVEATNTPVELDGEFARLKLPKLPNGVFTRKFTSRVDLPRDDDDEWEN